MLQRLTFRFRLILLTMVTITVALLLALTGTIYNERVLLREKIAEDLTTIVKITGIHSAAALTFDDVKAGQQTLAALREEDSIITASLFTAEGRLFARYLREGSAHSYSLSNVWLMGDSLEIVKPITLDGEVIGKLYIRSDLGKLEKLLWQSVKSISAIFLIILSLTFLLAFWLQRSVTKPILRLAKLAQRINTENDFSLRAVKENTDEVGILTDGFNAMLNRIQQRESDLQQSEKRLAEAQKVARIGHWEWDLQTGVVHLSDQVHNILGTSPSETTEFFAVLLNIVHPDDRSRVEAVINRALQRKEDFQVKHKIIITDDDIRTIQQKAKIIANKNNIPIQMIGTVQDVTALVNAEQHRHLAYFDTVTGLPNRAFLMEFVSHALAATKRAGKLMAVMFIDLDHFKRINDTLGHSAGDLVLKSAAQRLKKCLRQSDIVAREPISNEEMAASWPDGNALTRFGGDEFVIVLTELDSKNKAAIVASRITDAMARPFAIHGSEVRVGASIGLSLYPHHGADVETLLKNADAAMYRAKKTGRSSYQFYADSIDKRAIERYALLQDLHKALERNELKLYYQPKMDISSEAISGVEGLLRWEHPDKGMISPEEFIPLAEETGLIVQIGEWALRTACKQVMSWRNNGLPSLSLAVNVSVRQLNDKNFSAILGRTLKETGLEPQCLELEITESILMDVDGSIVRLTALKALRILISLDDFGTGYSSLSYLKHLPIDILKIDRSFITDSTINKDSAALIAGIIDLSHKLRLKVIAEGVETQEQLDFLREHECNEIQGYFYSRPLTAEEFNQRFIYRLA